MEAKPVVTRIAPSPTGHLHIGTARTALINYLYARHHGGTFIVRSEDTDRARSTKEFETEILAGLEWLGLEADQFYRQSDRTSIYKNHLEALIENGTAYVSREPSKQDPAVEVEVVRLKNQNKIITFTDLVRGDISFDTTELGDFVIARSLTDPLYHFTVVVDDFLSEVTHVIRGEDHISNTPRQILIQEAIGAQRPDYVHLPLILAPDRSKLSKRHGAVALREYQNEGFLPEAVVNYLALLGWSAGGAQEVFSLTELTKLFTLDHIQKGGAVFDIEKFKWFNREHIRRMSDAELIDAVRDFVPVEYRGTDADTNAVIARLIPLIRERTYTLKEVADGISDGEYSFAFAEPDYDTSLLKWKKDPDVSLALPRLKRAMELISLLPEMPTADEVRSALWDYAESEGRGEVLWPLRVALSGRAQSADPFTLIAVLGREKAKQRITVACAKIEG